MYIWLQHFYSPSNCGTYSPHDEHPPKDKAHDDVYEKFDLIKRAFKMSDFDPIVAHEIDLVSRGNRLVRKAFRVCCNGTCKPSLRGTLVCDNKAGFDRAAK